MSETSIPELVNIAATAFADRWKAKDYHFFIHHNAALTLGLFSQANGLRAYFLGLLAGGTLDVISIAVATSERRQGLAKRMMLELLSHPKVERCTLEVNTNNLAAIALYQHLGFSIRSTRKNYYQGKWDAYFMTWER